MRKLIINNYQKVKRNKIDKIEEDEKEVKGYLTDANNKQFTMSSKASDLARKIGTGLIAVLWSTFFIPNKDFNDLKLLSLIFVVIYFFIDFLQYFITSCQYRCAYNKLNRKKINIKIYKENTNIFSNWSATLYISKSIILLISILLFGISLFV